MNKKVICIREMEGKYYATVEFKGHRYLGIYVHKVSESDVLEDFTSCKSSFYHIN